MIIDKVQPYWTEEDRKALADIQRAQERFINEIQRKEKAGTLEDGILTEWKSLDGKAKAIREDVEDRYIKSFRHNKKGILEDIEEIVQTIEREDFQARVKEQLAQLIVWKVPNEDLRFPFGLPLSGYLFTALMNCSIRAALSCFIFSVT